MIYSVEIGGQDYTVEIRQNAEGGLLCRIDDSDPIVIDAKKVAGGDWSIVSGDSTERVGAEVVKDRVYLQRDGHGYVVSFSEQDVGSDYMGGKQKDNRIVSSMPGVVTEVMVSTGERVAEGQGLLVVEAMKMQNEFTAPFDGVIQTVDVAVNQTIDGGATLLSISPEKE